MRSIPHGTALYTYINIPSPIVLSKRDSFLQAIHSESAFLGRSYVRWQVFVFFLADERSYSEDCLFIIV